MEAAALHQMRRGLDGSAIGLGDTDMCELNKGDVVQVKPDTELWMRGMRFGEVLAVRRKPEAILIHVNAMRLWVDPAAVLEA